MNKLFKSPHPFFITSIFLLTLVICAVSIFFAVNGYTGVIAYIVFALSALLLGYCIYVAVLFRTQIKDFAMLLVNKSTFAKKYTKSFGFRTVISSFISFSSCLLLGIANFVWSILDDSIWFGALSAYYILTALIYGVLILNLKTSSYKAYKRCGFFMAILNVALSFAIAQMIFDNRAFEYGEIMVFVFAAYAFYKLTMAIIRFFKTRGNKSPSLRAIALVNLMSGAVSILALQTALLSAFSEGTYVSLFNTLTGIAVSLSSIGISIFMIVTGTKKINLEKNHEQQ